MNDTLQQRFDAGLNQVPEVLQASLAEHWQAFRAHAASIVAAAGSDVWLESLPRVWACSEFVARACLQYPQMLEELVTGGELLRAREEGEVGRQVGEALAGVGDEAELKKRLRGLRRRELVRIAWRDLAGWADLEEVITELSWFAEACIDTALAQLHAWQQVQVGTPRNAAGEPQSLVVLGMGKLGARELNFSSDVDLIFAYPQEGETDGERALSNHEYFIRLGRRLIAALNDTTEDGFVFRVDMRLRPNGDSGPLALSFGAMEHYYQVHGREWERYAMVKARVVGGDRAAGADLLAALRPFVYRRYLDYGAFESLREMKQMVALEVRRKGMERNIKLGAGGIREIEFIGQAFQLIRGGREPALQERRILPVLEHLGRGDHLPGYAVAELSQAYIFLRRVEHRLQEFADKQTHDLPGDDVGRARLAFAMGFDGRQAFSAALAEHRARVDDRFEQVFAAPQAQHAASDALNLAGVWAGGLDEAAAPHALQAAGFEDAGEALRRLRALREGRNYQALSAQGRARMDRLMPLLIGAAGQAAAPGKTLERLLGLVERIAQRTAYLALLVENPMALSQLVKLCAASPWIANYLGQHPLLLDGLLDPRSLYVAQTREALGAELRARLESVPGEDLEQVMDALRHFKQAAVLRVAAADVSGAMRLMVVSDHLTWIAEAVLEEALESAWRYLVARHGRPLCTSEGEVCDKGFAVVAYGKLGGIELGYGSDLDLVFLHGAERETLETTGERPVPVPVFFARLGQRLIHILTTRTPAGVLYEVDTRLRPNGASGMMVSNLQAFEEYQQRSAWTWEHQALVRTRVVAGDPLVARRFEAIRREVLGRRREPAALRKEVREMRERMREALSKGKPGHFDIKQDPGGIADIEFMVQYGVLAWARDHPGLLTYPDNIRLLAGFAENSLLPQEDVDLLSETYRLFRARVHGLALQEQFAVVPGEEFAAQREGVLRIWQTLMEDPV